MIPMKPGDEFTLYAPGKQPMRARLLPHLIVVFGEGSDAPEPPMHCRTLGKVESVVRSRFPDAYFDDWQSYTFDHHPGFECPGDSEEFPQFGYVTTLFFPTEADVIHEEMRTDPNRLHDAGAISWAVELLDASPGDGG